MDVPGLESQEEEAEFGCTISKRSFRRGRVCNSSELLGTLRILSAAARLCTTSSSQISLVRHQNAHAAFGSGHLFRKHIESVKKQP